MGNPHSGILPIKRGIAISNVHHGHSMILFLFIALNIKGLWKFIHVRLILFLSYYLCLRFIINLFKGNEMAVSSEFVHHVSHITALGRTPPAPHHVMLVACDIELFCPA